VPVAAARQGANGALRCVCPMQGDMTLVADMCAGWAVGKGALLAGSLRKRSDWLKEWNARFFVLTTNEIVWFSRSDIKELKCASWRFDTTSSSATDRRAITILSGVTAEIKGDIMVVTSANGKDTIQVKAATEAELKAWRDAIEQVLLGLELDARLARTFVRERGLLFSDKGFEELPHTGSRNHLERSVRKTYYACTKAAAKKSALSKMLGGGGDDDYKHLLMSLTTLPPNLLEWTEDQSIAFSNIVDAITQSAHPTLSPPTHQELCLKDGRLVTVRRLLPNGSLRDLIHKVPDPKLPCALKYGRAVQTAPAPPPTPAAAGTSSLGGSPSTGSVGAPLERSPYGPQPLPPAKMALFGRQLLEGLRFLKAAGLPAVHVHASNLLLRKLPVPSSAPAHLGWAILISEVELGLIGCTAYAEARELAQPRLALGATVPYSVTRDVLAFGHVLFEMLTAKELSESELSRCVGARLHSPVFPGPVAAWNVIFSIFLPSADVARGPTIVELLAEPFFSVELPPVWTDACAAATPPVFSGRDAALLKASRKRYGGDIVTIQPVTAADAKAAADAEAGLPPAAPPTAPGPVVVSDSPEKKKKKKAIATVSTHEIGEGPIGLTIAEEAGGRLVVATVAEGGQAAAAGVVVGGTLLAIGEQLISGLGRKELEELIGRASRPLVMRIQAPTTKAKAAERRRSESSTVPPEVSRNAAAHDGGRPDGSASLDSKFGSSASLRTGSDEWDED